MPMGIVSDVEFERERSRLENPPPPNPIPVITPDIIITPSAQGRGKGNKEVPDSLRKLIGEEAAVNGRQSGLEMARAFGISDSSVSAYTNGSTSTTSYDKQPNLNHINERKQRVAKLATNRLRSALKHINDEKLSGSKATELSSIARDMSVIVKNMEPSTPHDTGNKGNGPTFVIFKPEMNVEADFARVTVKE